MAQLSNGLRPRFDRAGPPATKAEGAAPSRLTALINMVFLKN